MYVHNQPPLCRYTRIFAHEAKKTFGADPHTHSARMHKDHTHAHTRTISVKYWISHERDPLIRIIEKLTPHSSV